MNAASVMSRWTDSPREWGRSAGNLLACVYTCEAHRGLLDRFYSSEVGTLLRATPGVCVVEVYADAGFPASRLEGNRILLRSNENYRELSIKTHRMIEFGVRHFHFDNLLKIDVTTVMTQAELGSPEYSERKAMDMAAIADFLRHADYGQDYLGFKQHAKAGREGVENWAKKKGLAIDYPRLFGDGLVPPYYTGKCYVVSRRFAEFVARTGAGMAEEQRQYLPGSEDVMIGRLYDQFNRAGVP